jgi:ABC-type nitrate/sulfonate/bicarbonate transport system ATPase subunit
VLLTAAVASHKPVLLLDEALAQLDPLTRAALRRRSLFAGRTVLEVLHEQ